MNRFDSSETFDSGTRVVGLPASQRFLGNLIGSELIFVRLVPIEDQFRNGRPQTTHSVEGYW